MPDRVFSECRNLRSVLLEDGLKFIGTGCFEKSGLEEITIPGGVKRIEL